MHPDKDVTFTVTDPLPRNGYDTPISITQDGDGNFDIAIRNYPTEPPVCDNGRWKTNLKIDCQQMYELGVLFLALADKDVDIDAAFELIEGFGYDAKEVVGRVNNELADW